MTHDTDGKEPDEFDGLLQNLNESGQDEDSNFEGQRAESLVPRGFAPSFIQLRRLLDRAREEARPVRKELEELHSRQRVGASREAAAVLACVSINERYPIDDPDDESFQRALAGVQAGDFQDHIPDAIAEMDSFIDLLEKAKFSLHTLDVFDRPTLSAWTNLPVRALARAINAHAYIIFQAAIVR